jgi:ubiquitin C-terminal hydrolase
MLSLERLYEKRNGGLRNIGSTCYANTLIQCLSVCDSFMLFLFNQEENYKNRLNNNKKNELDNIFLITELKMIYESLVLDGNSLIPRRFIKCLSNKFDYFNIFQQNDIHEMLLMIINKLNEEIKFTETETKIIFNKMLLKHKKYILDNDKNNSINDDNNENKYNQFKEENIGHWFNLHSKEYSEIIECFYGHQISQIVCGNCDFIHHNHEYFNCLNLELPVQINVGERNSSNKDLYDCIKQYTSKIMLNNGDNNEIEWKCDKCNCKKKSDKIIKFWNLPPVLIINLKRFVYDAKKDRLSKNDIKIDIPFNLNFKNYILQRNNNINYELKGIGLHYGNIRGGHYVSMIRKNNNNDNEWLYIDDEIISETTKDKIPFQNAYVLFYNLKMNE